MAYSFKNIIGSYAIDKDMKVISKDDKGLVELSPEEYKKAIFSFKDRKYFAEFFRENLILTKKQIKASVGEDNLIIQAIRVIDDLNHVSNILAKRLREWYELYHPELSREISAHEEFADRIISGDGMRESGMGADLTEEDLDAIRSLAHQVKSLHSLKEKERIYIEGAMRRICPNLLDIAGALIGAKLLLHAGSLKHLSEFPASTIQLLGAEKALFKHIRSGAKCPKYGLIFNHPFVVQARPRLRGKAARLLADKLSIAVKVDFFKGEPISEKLKMQLMEKGEKLR